MKTGLDPLALEDGLFKDLSVRCEIDLCTGLFGLSDNGKQTVLQFRCGNAAGICIPVDLASAGYFHCHLAGKRIDNGRTDTVQTARSLVCLIIEFAAGMQRSHDNTFRGYALLMHIDGQASSVILHRTGSVFLQRYMDLCAEPCQMLVDRVIQDLIHQMVETL